MGDFGQFSIKIFSYEEIRRRNGYYLTNSSLLCCISINILINFNKPTFDNPKQHFLVVVLVCQNQTTKELSLCHWI